MKTSVYRLDDLSHRRYLIHHALVPAGCCKRKDANTDVSTQRLYSTTEIESFVTCTVCLRWLREHRG